MRKTAARRDAATAGARQPCVTHVFLGAKGGAGTTTVAVNCAVELARLTKRPTAIVDLKPCLGEVALFLGVRPRFTRARRDREPAPPGSRVPARAGVAAQVRARHPRRLRAVRSARTRRTRPPIEELLRVLGKLYDYIVIDAGNMINACAVAALYAADTVFLVANPDVPSIRNAQRLVDRVRQLGAGSERIKVLLNRTTDQHLIAPKQIETALGYGIHHSFSSDYRTVSTALNSGVPLTLTNHSDISAQFGSFAKGCSAWKTPRSNPSVVARFSDFSNRGPFR